MITGSPTAIHISINVREYRRSNTKLTIQRIGQHRVHKTKKNKNTTQHTPPTTIRKQTNKTRTLPQTTEGKDKPNIALKTKPQRTPQHTRHIIGQHKKTKANEQNGPHQTTVSELMCWSSILWDTRHVVLLIYTVKTGNSLGYDRGKKSAT